MSWFKGFRWGKQCKPLDKQLRLKLGGKWYPCQWTNDTRPDPICTWCSKGLVFPQEKMQQDEHLQKLPNNYHLAPNSKIHAFVPQVYFSSCFLFFFPNFKMKHKLSFIVTTHKYAMQTYLVSLINIRSATYLRGDVFWPSWVSCWPPPEKSKKLYPWSWHM